MPTLLLADDSVTIQRVIELTFADEDVVVVAVGNGDEAIERVEASPPDIVLADIGMPGRNGYEVARYIKTTPHLAHIPVVLLTGAFEPVDQARATEAGCDGVLAKPFEPQLVIGRVKELLAKAASAPAAPPPRPTPAAARPFDAASLPIRQTPTPPREDVADYFDRLDAAFSNLSAAAVTPKRRATPSPASIDEDIDWFGTAQHETKPLSEQWDLPAPARPTPAAPPDLPLSYPPRATPAAQPRTMTMTASESKPPSADAAAEAQTPRAGTSPAPPLSDVFAALLAAEQQAGPDLPAAWPASAGAAPAITPDVIDEVTKRVLAALSERVVRDAVAELVSNVAEKLVREEIDRIKASIK